MEEKDVELRWALLGSWAIDKLCPPGLDGHKFNGGLEKDIPQKLELLTSAAGKKGLNTLIIIYNSLIITTIE